ncbi:acyl-CoA synthetase [Curvibacter sp. APW13]|uniref:acyl-CoA synthetase n=1 Tax=Curvibacter sp. APW13 TaxID=3077236 RepID=UPI0028E02B9B|nr:acyl-CoA synthetase [Curvibacter sp. APW13]MDT8989369.1 acyl-CoA synthetase [Curvibacter sp. APW13]
MKSSITTLTDIVATEQQGPCIPTGINSTYDLLMRGAALGSDRPALSFFLRTEDHTRPHTWTYTHWSQAIVQAANMFRSLGVQRDTVIAYILPNLPETHLTIWGGETAGIVMAINPLLEPAMMSELLKAAKPRMLVTLAPTPGTDIWQKVVQAIHGVDSLERVLTVTPLKYLPGPLSGALAWIHQLRTPRCIGKVRVDSMERALRHHRSDRLTFAPPKLDDTASYFCTGGTTGLPKIAVRSHRTEVANALQVAAVFGEDLYDKNSNLFCGLPLFHVNAQIGTGLTPWSAGAHVILGTPQGYRAPGLLQRFWEIVAHHRIVTFSGVPTVYAALLQFPPKDSDIRTVRFGVCGAAPMPMELYHRFQKETGIKVIEGYGLTEGGCVSSLNPIRGEARFGSIGMRLPWQPMRIAILDETGRWVRDAKTDESGVIAIRGPNLFKGYLDHQHNQGLWLYAPEDTQKAQPWLNTGDLGRVDGEGYYWLTGRKKELIIRGGHNIDPKQIEEALSSHPCVALAAAVGRPDAYSGEVPVAYVQLRPGLSASSSELLAYATEKLRERAAVPKEVCILDALPVTAIGKIFKPALMQIEISAVVQDQAKKLGIPLRNVRVVLDPTKGFVAFWSVQEGDSAALERALGEFTFAWMKESP